MPKKPSEETLAKRAEKEKKKQEERIKRYKDMIESLRKEQPRLKRSLANIGNSRMFLDGNLRALTKDLITEADDVSQSRSQPHNLLDR